MEQVHLQEEATQFGLGLQVLDFLYPVGLQPEAAQPRVLFQVLDAIETWREGVVREAPPYA